MQNKHGVDPIELSLYRMIINSFFTFIAMHFKFNKKATDVPRKYWKDLYIRSLTGLTAFTCMVLSTKWLPITILTLLHALLPFFASVNSYLILGEVLEKIEFLGMIISFCGVVILVNSKTESKNDITSSNYYHIGLLVGIIRPFMFSLS
jgi:drug/metabolite transporter (DMT)-like permease